MQRILLLFVALLILSGIGFAGWYLFFRTEPGLTPTPGALDPFSGTGAGNVSGNGSTAPEMGVPMQGAGEEVAPKLFRIASSGVAEGSVVFDILVPQAQVGTSSAPLPPLPDVEVRFIERASGNMYRFQLGTRELERLTNQTLPGIQEAVFASDGSRAFVRYSVDDQVETYALPADGTEGYALQSNLSDVVVTGTSSVLTVLPNTNGSVATRATLAGTNPATVFSSLLSALTVRAAGQNYVAYTKPSAGLPGYVFGVNRTSGEFTRVLGPSTGLAALPNPAGTKYFHSSMLGATLQSGVVDATTRASTAIPVATLAEKCVWSSDGASLYCAVPRTTPEGLPDSWYQGTVSTSDRFWKVDLETRVASLLVDPVLVGDTEIDASHLAIDAAGRALVFTNRLDGSLWLYDL